MITHVNNVCEFIERVHPTKQDLTTFCYIFREISKGYYFSIRNGRIKHAIFFTNPNFENSWHNEVKIKNNLNSVHQIKAFVYNSEQNFHFANSQKGSKINVKNFKKNKPLNIDYSCFELDVARWYANNALCRFDKKQKCVTDRPNCVYEYVTEMCANRPIKDCSFFLNIRDSPIDAKHNLEPYFHIYGTREKPPQSLKICSTVLSFCTQMSRYNDIPIPTLDDWTQIKTIPQFGFLPWEKRISKVVFRGSSTGFSAREKHNPRLALLKFKNDPRLDVGITKWQTRPRFNKGFLEFIPENIIKNNPCVKYMSPKKQAHYKFILSVPGNCFAFRLSREFRSGCCIFLVESEWTMWYSGFMEPFIHYIPVKNDLSDFEEKLDWAFSNMSICATIAQNGMRFFNKFFTRENVYDYVATCLNQAAEN